MRCFKNINGVDSIMEKIIYNPLTVVVFYTNHIPVLTKYKTYEWPPFGIDIRTCDLDKYPQFKTVFPEIPVDYPAMISFSYGLVLTVSDLSKNELANEIVDLIKEHEDLYDKQIIKENVNVNIGVKNPNHTSNNAKIRPLNNERAFKIKFVATDGDCEYRRFRLPSDISFELLSSVIQSKFGLDSVRIFYKDQDKDLIQITDDDELLEFWNHCGKCIENIGQVQPLARLTIYPPFAPRVSKSIANIVKTVEDDSMGFDLLANPRKKKEMAEIFGADALANPKKKKIFVVHENYKNLGATRSNHQQLQ